MRIFQAIEGSANAAVARNNTWHRNLHEPLIELGHDVVLFSVEEGRRAMQRHDEGARCAFSAHLLHAFELEHRRQPFQLFFGYLMDGMIEPAVIDAIRGYGVLTANFSCNNIHQFDLVDELSPHFDVNLHSERDAREKFLAIGACPFWWPMSSNPKYFRPFDLPRDIAVSFVGANYGPRSRCIAHLLENGINLQAFGPGWRWAARNRARATAAHYLYIWRAMVARGSTAQATASSILSDHDFRRALSDRFPDHLHEPVDDDTLVQLYSRSEVSLGILEVYDHHDPSRPVARHLHLRDFEAPMCGALYVTGFTEELAQMFEPDREVLVYRNHDELLEKIRRAMRDRTWADAVRAAGHRRALADHTPHVRYAALFKELGLIG